MQQLFRRTRGLVYVLALGSLLTPTWANCPAVGAIRWDAWFGEKGMPGKAVEKTLGPERWHGRLPTCAQVLGPDRVCITCDTPDQMAQEMKAAVEGGIDFWAFVTYPEDDPMSSGLKSYLASTAKPTPSFAAISEFVRWGGKDQYRPIVDRYIRMMADKRYQRTEDGRPLFFLGFITEASIKARFGDREGFAAAVQDFRERALAAGVGNPFIVVLEGWLEKAQSYVADFKLDGISSYMLADGKVQRGTYKQLSDYVEQYWTKIGKSNVAYVPTVMTGWDRRPRAQNPVPWGAGAPPIENAMEKYYAPPTPAELQAHLAAAMKYSAQQSAPGQPKAVLIYAWNEFDEGGWLAPTRGEGAARLAAVRRAVSIVCPAPAKGR